MKISRDFEPGLAHRFYFIRRSILKGIIRYSTQIGGKILDFGCGSKPYRSLFPSEEYYGLDYENPGHDHSNESIDVFYDGKTIPFDNCFFDSILSTEVIEHVFELDNTLHEFNRVLRKNGVLLITCPFVWPEHEKPYDFARYTYFALKYKLELSGFEILAFEKGGNFIEVIAQLRVLDFVQWAEPKLRSFGRLGYLVLNTGIFFKNSLGKLKSKLFKSNTDLYLSNIILARKK